MLGSIAIEPARLQWRARGSSGTEAGSSGSPPENDRVRPVASLRARSVTPTSISPDARSTAKPGGPAVADGRSTRAAGVGSGELCRPDALIVARTAPALLTVAV